MLIMSKTKDFNKLVQEVREVFKSGRTKHVPWREQQLMSLLRMVNEHGDDMMDAMYKDLHKPAQESYVMEVNFLRSEIVNALNNLDVWVKRDYVKKVPLVGMMDSPFIQPEPYGVVLIIGAWNYPIQLILHVLVGAIAAGNCAVMKPSELSVNTAQLLEKLVSECLDAECFKVVNGDVPVTTSLLKQRFDYILYTGNSMVGKIVLEAAAKHLTPVTLEMGGKSPTYVDRTVNMNITAKRILWGKFCNSGQTCVAPDYILCDPSIKDELVNALKTGLKEFYGEDPKTSDSFGRIVNTRHWNRLKTILDNTHGKIAYGGSADEKDLYIQPTIIVDVTADDACMRDEIFGPVLPILTVKSVDDAICFINEREKPLQLYIFSKDQAVVDKIVSCTSSGAMCINDTLMTGAVDTLPFGGVGYSGLGGGYHGKHTFDIFSHKKAVLHRATVDELLLSARYPPYTPSKLGTLKFLTTKKLNRKSFVARLFPLVVIGAFLAFAVKFLGLQQYLPLTVAKFLKLE